MGSVHSVFEHEGMEPGPDPVPRQRSPRPSRRRPTPASERRAIQVVAVLAALAAALGATGAATGIAVVDGVWRALLAGVVTLLGARARRWSWLVTAGAVTVAAGSGPWLAVGLAALAVALGAALRPRRRLPGAVVGAVAVQVALHLPDYGWFPASSVAAIACLAPMVLSGLGHLPRPVARRTRRGALVALAVVAVVAGMAAASALLAAGPARTGEEQARRGFDAARDGELSRAATDLNAAASSFESAERWAGGWWTLPARLVPVVSQHVAATSVGTAQSAAVSRAAAASAAEVDPDTLRYEDGRLDLDQVRAAEPLLTSTAVQLGDAEVALGAARSPWLVPPVAGPLDALEGLVADAAPGAETAALAVAEVPGLLGGDGTRRYLVLFTQPAEARGLGGFVGAWAVLTADDGEVTMTDSGRALDINEAPGRADRRVTGPPDYVARWGRFLPGRYFQDVTLSPDLPSVAQAATEVYAAAGGGAVDGVIVVDPLALAGLLEITGPIRVDGLDEALGPDNAADWLLRRQYTELPEREERADLLEELSRRALDELVSGDLPSGRRLVELLGDPVGEGRLGVWVFDADGVELLDRMGASQRLPEASGQDLFGVVVQNGANNKIDTFLRRSVRYEPTVNPAEGFVTARATITLANDAPAAGLPDAVIGSNDRGLPPGTNRLHLSVYTPLGLRGATVDGVRVPFESQRELGWSAYSRYLEIPPGGEIELDLLLSGRIEPIGPEGTYVLDVLAQPLAEPQELEVRVRPEVGWVAVPLSESPPSLEATADDDAVVVSGQATRPVRIATELLVGGSSP